MSMLTKKFYLQVQEIFLSIDGETNFYHQGRFTVFLRLAGCNLNCSYCDTQYAQTKNNCTLLEISSVAKTILNFKCNNLTITGGEPLLQQEALYELLSLLGEDFNVSIETNGTIDPYNNKNKEYRVSGTYIGSISYVVDYKLTSSGCEEALNITNFLSLDSDDFVKFVVSDISDIKRAIQIKEKLKEYEVNCKFVISPIFGKIEPSVIIDYLKNIKEYDFILNIQIHKLMQLKEGEQKNG